MQVDPYLLFNGQCEAAFNFYAQILGGKVEGLTTYADSPMAEHVPPEWRDKVVHARLTIGDKVIMGSDPPPGQYQKQAGFAMTAGAATPAEAERVFDALAENGTVQMPLQQTFWSPSFGMLTDRFGIPWMVNCEHAA